MYKRHPTGFIWLLAIIISHVVNVFGLNTFLAKTTQYTRAVYMITNMYFPDFGSFTIFTREFIYGILAKKQVNKFLIMAIFINGNTASKIRNPYMV